jgi:hypothetical protein
MANATVADLTAPNNLGNIFVADIFSPQTGNTKPVDVTAGGLPTSIPVPRDLRDAACRSRLDGVRSSSQEAEIVLI